MTTLAPFLQDPRLWLRALADCAQLYNVAQINTDDAHASLFTDDEYIRIVFRGSKSAEDWVNDGKFAMVETEFGWVHSGFWTGFSGIRNLVGNALVDLNTEDLKILVEGHSLAGAHAELMARDIRKNSKYNLAGAITFGCPFVGGVDWQNGYDADLKDVTIRLVDANDIVPRVPPELLGYRQVGHEALLPSKGGIEYDPTKWELDVADVEGIVSGIQAGQVTILTDHHLENYQARIEALP